MTPENFPKQDPVPQPQPQPTPWWEYLPKPPDWLWGIPGKAIEQIFRERY
ncbi:MAG: hypothetical protein ACRC11_11405 [Xenococcaceae cyanobacterium]